MEKIRVVKGLIAIIVSIIIFIGIAGSYYFYNQAKTQKFANEKIKAELALVKSELEKSKNELASLKTTNENTNSAVVSTTCVTEELTTTQEEMISDWVPFVHNNVNYTFKYPQNWTMKSVESEMAVFEYAKDGIYFRIRNEETTRVGFEMTKISSKNIKVACQDAIETTYSTDGSETLVTSFKKGKIPYAVIITFEDKGASYSGDIIDQYEAILKTMNFN